MGYFLGKDKGKDEDRRLWKDFEEEANLEERDKEDFEDDGFLESLNEDDYWDGEEQEEEEIDEDLHEVPKAPFWVRLAVWASTIAIFFAIGYWGSDLAIKWMDKKGYLRQSNVIADKNDMSEGVVGSSGSESALHVSVFKIYLPGKVGLVEEKVRVPSGLLEDELRQTLSTYVEKCAASGVLRPEMKVLHLFRSGDRLYVDMNKPFLDSLRAVGHKSAGVIITSIVSTVVNNFPPITKVKFLIEGKAVEDKDPVNLASFWALPSS